MERDLSARRIIKSIKEVTGSNGQVRRLYNLAEHRDRDSLIRAVIYSFSQQEELPENTNLSDLIRNSILRSERGLKGYMGRKQRLSATAQDAISQFTAAPVRNEPLPAPAASVAKEAEGKTGGKMVLFPVEPTVAPIQSDPPSRYQHTFNPPTEEEMKAFLNCTERKQSGLSGALDKIGNFLRGKNDYPGDWMPRTEGGFVKVPLSGCYPRSLQVVEPRELEALLGSLKGEQRFKPLATLRRAASGVTNTFASFF